MTTQPKDHEKRQFLRLPREMSISVNRLEYPLSTKKGEAVISKNLSGNGICFLSPKQYEPNTLLDLKIDLRGWQQHLRNISAIVDTATLTKPLTAIGEVIWSKELPDGGGYEVGVSFKDIYEDDHHAFLKYIGKITENHK